MTKNKKITIYISIGLLMALIGTCIFCCLIKKSNKVKNTMELSIKFCKMKYFLQILIQQIDIYQSKWICKSLYEIKLTQIFLLILMYYIYV